MHQIQFRHKVFVLKLLGIVISIIHFYCSIGQLSEPVSPMVDVGHVGIEEGSACYNYFFNFLGHKHFLSDSIFKVILKFKLIGIKAQKNLNYDEKH